MLDCQVEGEGPISITWRRNGVPVETGVRAAVLSNGTLLIRTFSKKQENNQTDAGEYDCAAQNRFGLLISRKARVLLACESHDRLEQRTNMQLNLMAELIHLYSSVPLQLSPSSCLTQSLWQ